jgi:hypothetical protein
MDTGLQRDHTKSRAGCAEWLSYCYAPISLAKFIGNNVVKPV